MLENDSTVTNFLAKHPKMTGVLFTMLLLVTQAGTAVAGGSASMGP
jgi:hypothetical protein